MSWSHTLLGIALLAACAAPRTMTQSGRVTPRGEFRPSVSMNYNVGLASAGAILDGTKSAVGDIAETEGAISDKTVNKAVRAAVAYSLDPTFSAGTQLGLRYGVYERFDLGYNYAAGTHVLDARFQFLGQPGQAARRKEFGEEPGSFAGSIGLQYSQQEYELPSFAGLDKLAGRLGFEMSRKDILIPIAFSVPIGNDEKIGSFGFGAVAGYTSVKYGFFPNKLILLIDGVEEAAKPVSHEQGFLSYGGFVNMHLGYRYLYFVPSVAVYYQDFGSFEVLGGSKFSISGLSIVPSLGLEGRF